MDRALFGLPQPCQTVEPRAARQPSLAPRQCPSCLPTAGLFFECEGERLYRGLVEGFRGQQFGGPPPAKPGKHCWMGAGFAAGQGSTDGKPCPLIRCTWQQATGNRYWTAHSTTPSIRRSEHGRAAGRGSADPGHICGQRLRAEGHYHSRQQRRRRQRAAHAQPSGRHQRSQRWQQFHCEARRPRQPVEPAGADGWEHGWVQVPMLQPSGAALQCCLPACYLAAWGAVRQHCLPARSLLRPSSGP